jgi:hypothetical protein
LYTFSLGAIHAGDKMVNAAGVRYLGRITLMSREPCLARLLTLRESLVIIRMPIMDYGKTKGLLVL